MMRGSIVSHRFKKMVHIIIIDDHALVREGIVSLITEMIPDAVLTALDRIPSDQLILSKNAALVICDYRVGDHHALSLLQALGPHSAAPPVLIISMLTENEVGPACVLAGAKGFVSKAAPATDFLAAVRMLLAGNTYLSASLARALLAAGEEEESSGPPSPSRRLSCRELQVFCALGEGLAVSSVADRLGISVKTVEAHRENIKNKLLLNSAAAVVISAAHWLTSGT